MKNVWMSLDLWPPNNPWSQATNWGLSMVSGSQLQVAKLAQMCPAAPSGTQQRTTAPSGCQQCSAAASGSQRQPGSKPQSKPQSKPGSKPRSKPRVKTRMEHLGAPCSTKCPFKICQFKIRRVKTFIIRIRPESRGPQGALGDLI